MEEVSNQNMSGLYVFDTNSRYFLTKNDIIDILKDNSNGIDEHIDLNKAADKIILSTKTDISLSSFQEYLIRILQELILYDPNYEKIAINIIIKEQELKSQIDGKIISFSQISDILAMEGLVSREYNDFVQKYKNELNPILNYKLNYNITIFGYRTLERAYLIKTNKGFNENQQHLHMRVAVGIHYKSKCDDFVKLDYIRKSYDIFSNKYATHATPTLFNSGKEKPQMSSCFLLGNIEDSMDSITKYWCDSANISKYAGGLGIGFTNIRSKDSIVRSTGGKTKGLDVMKVFESIGKYADQGGKRNGSIACYLETWHPDIIYFLETKKLVGDDDKLCKDLFIAIMIHDIFMRYVKEDKEWYLFCPDRCPNLTNKFGEDFEREYLKCVEKKLYKYKLPARQLWLLILDINGESGTPYLLSKDTINRKSNYDHIGVVNISNLCSEIVQYSSPEEHAVCNLCSLILPTFVVNKKFDFQKLIEVTKMMIINLNNIIDINFYPTKEARFSNFRHRPIGVGIQGLADVFMLLDLPFTSPQARQLNKHIMETIYYACFLSSVELAKEYGHYDTFKGSNFSKGLFQFDLWNAKPELYDWESVKNDVVKFGTRNAVFTTLMPTASTSQIAGANECFEPYTENIYLRGTNAGEYYVINKHLVTKLKELNLWNEDMVDLIKYNKGSISNIDIIPEYIKQIYLTVWDIPKKDLIEMAADRGPFVDQTQSMNIFVKNADRNVLNSCYFYGWELGLKTLVYYVRSKPASDPLQFGIDISKINKLKKNTDDSEDTVCMKKEGCIVCSS